MSFTKFIIDIAVKNPKIESYNNYLFIGPHPDDIEIGAGATVSKLKKLNKKVTFLICLDGRFGKENLKEDISCEQLIEIRKNECLESAKLLGVDNCLFLSLCDGGQYSDREVLEGIAKTINDIKLDYNLDNIMLSTQSENMKRMFVNGHPNRIDKIFEIEMHDGQILRGTMKELQDMTGISRMTIYDRFYNQRPGRKNKNVRLIG